MIRNLNLSTIKKFIILFGFIALFASIHSPHSLDSVDLSSASCVEEVHFDKFLEVPVYEKSLEPIRYQNFYTISLFLALKTKLIFAKELDFIRIMIDSLAPPTIL